MISNRKWHVPTIAAAVLVVSLSGCTSATDGNGVRASESPTSSTTTTNTTAAFVAQSPEEVVDEIIAFWSRNDVDLTHVRTSEQSLLTCDEYKFPASDALFCDSGHNDMITWTPPFASGMSTSETGQLAGRITLAHEVGHAVQDFADKFQGDDGDRKLRGVKRAELSADCLSGFYIKHNTDVDTTPSEVAAALKETALADSPARGEAFELGQKLPYSSPNTCLVEYES